MFLCDLQVTSTKHENNLFISRGKVGYIWPSLVRGFLVHGANGWSLFMAGFLLLKGLIARKYPLVILLRPWKDWSPEIYYNHVSHVEVAFRGAKSCCSSWLFLVEMFNLKTINLHMDGITLGNRIFRSGYCESGFWMRSPILLL